MAVPVQVPTEVTTLPSGQTLSTLNFNFTYIDKSTVEVSVNGVELPTTQYNVVGQVINFTPPIGGIVGNSKIVVYLSMVYARTNDLIQASPIYALDLNKQLDRIVLMLQQSQFGVTKSIIFPPTDPDGLNTILPINTLRAHRALVFNSDGSVGVGGDLYTNQVALCQAQVGLATVQRNLATTQANISTNSAISSQAWATQLITPVSGTDYSAKYNANLAKDWANKPTDVEAGMPSAKTWAQAASATAIPDGSITANKMNPVETFTFQNLNCNQVITCDQLSATAMTAGSITSTGNVVSSNRFVAIANSWEYTSNVDANVANKNRHVAYNMGIETIRNNVTGAYGHRILDYTSGYVTQSDAQPGRRPICFASLDGIINSGYVVQSDFSINQVVIGNTSFLVRKDLMFDRYHVHLGGRISGNQLGANWTSTLPMGTLGIDYTKIQGYFTGDATFEITADVGKGQVLGYAKATNSSPNLELYITVTGNMNNGSLAVFSLDFTVAF
jgi:hypothetical protein